MNKVELLIPAGDFESLKQAVHNGCDAVYLGGKRFGARKFANNFDDEEMVNAIKLCHLYGVKIYVTVNTIVYENEIDDCINYLTFLHESGVDAVIMQDIGLITLVRKILPNLEIHASTQLHNHNKEDLLHLKELGIKRVVLARELSIDEIKNISGIVDLEIFIHGALCICYSGQCLFSSMIMNRSGNRGECAGLCRLPYKLVENNSYVKTDGNYLLSPREVNTSNKLKDLLDLGVSSFKVEGRMKSPYYVGFITKFYRKLIDQYYNNENMFVSENLSKELKVLYNREFTLGHLFKDKNNDLMNIKTPNHIGIELGNVTSVTKDKIEIELVEDLNQEDGIRFVNNETGMIANFIYDSNDMLINGAKKGEIIYLDNKVKLEEKTKVLKTLDSKLIKELSNYDEKKIEITINIEAKLGNKLYISLEDGINKVEEFGNIVEESINSPMSEERIVEQISKLGNTPFKVKELTVIVDKNIFISVKELNTIRRNLTDKLISLRENYKKEVIINYIDNSINEIINKNNSIKLNVLVRNEEQLKVVRDLNVNNIYITDYKLYLDNKDSNTYYRTDRVTTNIKNYNNENLLVGELGSFYKYKNNNKIVTDYYFNVVNSRYVNYLLTNKVDKVTLSVENDVDSIRNIVSNYRTIYGSNPSVEVLIYGKVELMVMKHCLLNMLINKNSNCLVCKNNNKYYLEDRNGERYSIYNDKCLTHIINSRNIDYSDNVKELINMGVSEFRIELFDEDFNDTKDIINKYLDLLK